MFIIQCQEMDHQISRKFMSTVFKHFFNNPRCIMFDDEEHLRWFAKFLDDKPTSDIAQCGYLLVHLFQARDPKSSLEKVNVLCIFKLLSIVSLLTHSCVKILSKSTVTMF